MTSSQPTSRQAPRLASPSEPQIQSPNDSDRSHHTWRSGEKSTGGAENKRHDKIVDQGPENHGPENNGHNDGPKAENCSQTPEIDPDKLLELLRLDTKVVRDHLRFFTRTVLPIIFGILFVIAATTLLIYTFGLKKAVSPQFVRKIGILFATVIGLWCVLCVCLWLRGKIRIGVALERANQARAQKDKKNGVVPEPKAVMCPLRKRRIKAAVIRLGVSRWDWVTAQLKLLTEKWEAHQNAKIQKREIRYGVRPYDEENTPPEPAPVGGLLDAAECPGKRASTFDKLLPTIYNPGPAPPERSAWDKIFGRHKVSIVQRRKSAIEREEQQRIAKMWGPRDFVIPASSAQDFIVSDPRERPVLKIRKPSIDLTNLGAGHHYPKKEPATTLTARPKPRYPAESSKVGNASTSISQRTTGQVKARESEIATNSPGDNLHKDQGNPDGHGSPPFAESSSAAGTPKQTTQAEVHSKGDNRQSPFPPSHPQPPKGAAYSGLNRSAPRLRPSILPRTQTLRRKTANSDLQVAIPSVPPGGLNLSSDTVYLPSDARTGLASILLAHGMQEAGMFPHQVVQPRNDSSYVSSTTHRQEQARKSSRSYQVDTRHKPFALGKALSNIPEVPSPEKLRSVANSNIVPHNNPAQQDRSLKRMSGRDDMRAHQMTRRPSRLQHEVPVPRQNTSRPPSLAVHESQQSMTQGSIILEDNHRLSTKIPRDIRRFSCPAALSAALSHTALDASLTIRPLNLPTRRAPSRILSGILDDGEDSRDSLVTGPAVRYRSPDVEDVSPRTSVATTASGPGAKLVDGVGNVGRMSVAPQLKLSVMDLKGLGGKGGVEFMEGDWI
ncbi:hypothetical protein VTL71DRAFT_5703 [Oculimacula yallundae]|uniref:Uncharacterized protein n=1 Tax=Oculimacula yallundae TaxID=86028 RepID=A0ABR4BZG1_9HELO